MTRRITKPLGRPPVRLGERMRIQVKDFDGELFPEVLLAAVVSCHGRVKVEVLNRHPVWHKAVLSESQFEEVKG